MMEQKVNEMPGDTEMPDVKFEKFFSEFDVFMKKYKAAWDQDMIQAGLLKRDDSIPPKEQIIK